VKLLTRSWWAYARNAIFARDHGDILISWTEAASPASIRRDSSNLADFGILCDDSSFRTRDSGWFGQSDGYGAINGYGVGALPRDGYRMPLLYIPELLLNLVPYPCPHSLRRHVPT
jgi:hypothetical protein